MPKLEYAPDPTPDELVGLVRSRLTDLGGSLRILAEGILGADAPIDLLAADPEGRVVLVLVTGRHDDLALVGRALAQRAWVAARLGDWLQLAPDLGILADAPVRAVLVGPSFSPTAVAAARAADALGIDLATYRCLRNGSGRELLLEPLWVAGAPAPPPSADRPPAAARFRTGLTDAELGLTPEERAAFD